jgi:uncharacterized protein (UPF0335 family)
MIEIAHEMRGPYVEVSAVKWNRLIGEEDAAFILENAADDLQEDAEKIEKLEERVAELEEEAKDLRAEWRARVRFVIRIARRMLAGKAGITSFSQLFDRPTVKRGLGSPEHLAIVKPPSRKRRR